MTDPKRINYYAFLMMGIAGLLFGLFGVSALLLDIQDPNGIISVRLIVLAPGMVLLGLALIYYTVKQGDDISILPDHSQDR